MGVDHGTHHPTTTTSLGIFLYGDSHPDVPVDTGFPRGGHNHVNLNTRYYCCRTCTSSSTTATPFAGRLEENRRRFQKGLLLLLLLSSALVEGAVGFTCWGVFGPSVVCRIPGQSPGVTSRAPSRAELSSQPELLSLSLFRSSPRATQSTQKVSEREERERAQFLSVWCVCVCVIIR